jgi:Protein of unknown function (DUF3667)
MSKHHLEHAPYCLNCHYPTEEFDKFCPNCGQKNTDGKVTVHELLHEFTHSLWHIEGKVFTTIRYLIFRPGRLTFEFFKGRQKRFAHPIQVFLVVMTALGFMFLKLNSLGKKANEENVLNKQVNQLVLIEKIDSARHISNYKNDTTLQKSLDSILLPLQKDILNSTYLWNRKKIITPKNATAYLDSLIEIDDDSIKYRDIMLLSEDSIAKSKGYNWYKKITSKAVIRNIKDGNHTTDVLMSRLPWVLFFSVPFLALGSMILYGKKRYYVEHLVFWLNINITLIIHATLVLAAVYLIKTFELPKIVARIFAFIFVIDIFLILLLSIKTFYQETWIKTIFKYTLSLIMYAVIFVFTIFLIGISAFLFG